MLVCVSVSGARVARQEIYCLAKGGAIARIGSSAVRPEAHRCSALPICVPPSPAAVIKTFAREVNRVLAACRIDWLSAGVLFSRVFGAFRASNAHTLFIHFPRRAKSLLENVLFRLRFRRSHAAPSKPNGPAAAEQRTRSGGSRRRCAGQGARARRAGGSEREEDYGQGRGGRRRNRDAEKKAMKMGKEKGEEEIKTYTTHFGNVFIVWLIWKEFCWTCFNVSLEHTIFISAFFSVSVSLALRSGLRSSSRFALFQPVYGERLAACDCLRSHLVRSLARAFWVIDTCAHSTNRPSPTSSPPWARRRAHTLRHTRAHSESRRRRAVCEHVNVRRRSIPYIVRHSRTHGQRRGARLCFSLSLHGCSSLRRSLRFASSEIVWRGCVLVWIGIVVVAHVSVLSKRNRWNNN